MSFDSLLVHRANIYEFDMSADNVDDYNMPVIKLKNTDPEYTNISCRVQHFIHKNSGFAQQEVELVEEKPATLFLPGLIFDPQHSNYVFHFSIDSDNFYIIQEMKALYAQSSTPHHYELLVVPLNEEVEGTYTAPN